LIESFSLPILFAVAAMMSSQFIIFINIGKNIYLSKYTYRGEDKHSFAGVLLLEKTRLSCAFYKAIKISPRRGFLKKEWFFIQYGCALVFLWPFRHQTL